MKDKDQLRILSTSVKSSLYIHIWCLAYLASDNSLLLYLLCFQGAKNFRLAGVLCNES